MRFDFKDEEVQDTGVRFPRVELKKDEIARICVISPYFEATVRHWVTRMGYIHCHAKAESFQDLAQIERDAGRPEECIMCRMAMNPELEDVVRYPLRHFATYILRYHTDPRGGLLHGQLAYHLEIWLMGNKKYRELIRMQEEWGSLQQHDLELNCIEAKYQNFDISLKKEAYWLKHKEEVATYLKAEAAKYPLYDCLGETVDKETLKRRFESVRRRIFPDEEVDLSGEALAETAAPTGSVFNKEDDPFGGGGEIPSVVNEEEKRKADEPEKTGTLDDLLP